MVMVFLWAEEKINLAASDASNISHWVALPTWFISLWTSTAVFNASDNTVEAKTSQYSAEDTNMKHTNIQSKQGKKHLLSHY